MKYALMFHHFHDETHHLKSQGSISKNEFSKMLDFLEAQYTILHPEDFTTRLENNALKKNDICLTFDDCLKCQYDIAYPVLQSRGLHAFFFIYSSALSTSPSRLEFYRDFRSCYFDSIDHFYEKFFNTTKVVFPKLYTQFYHQYPNNYLFAYSFYSEQDKRFRFLRDEILKTKKYYQLMDFMLTEANYSLIQRQKHLFMPAEVIYQLHKDGNAIGLHSHTHPTAIEKMTFDEQLNEYQTCQSFLKKITGKTSWSMSHPNGKYNQDTLSVLKKMGVRIGFRSSLTPLHITTALEVPREDHINLHKRLKATHHENYSIYE